MPAVPTVVPWLLGALALLLAIVRGVRMYKLMVQPDALAMIVKKQAEVGTLERVQKICSVIPETALGASLSAANGVAMELQKKEPPPTEDEIRAAMRNAYEPAFDAAVRPVFDTRWMAAVAFVAGAAAIALGFTADPPIRIAASLGALGLVGVAMNARAASKTIATAPFLDRVLPSYVDAIRKRIATMPETKKTLEEKNPYRAPKPVPIDDGDPRGWPKRFDSVLYGFDERSPDLFFEIVVAPFARDVGALRTVKLRRTDARPRFVIAVFGEGEALRRFRDKVEKEAPARYASCTTPAAEIAPDASYGPETRTHREVLDALQGGTLDVVATS